MLCSGRCLPLSASITPRVRRDCRRPASGVLHGRLAGGVRRIKPLAMAAEQDSSPFAPPGVADSDDRTAGWSLVPWCSCSSSFFFYFFIFWIRLGWVDARFDDLIMLTRWCLWLMDCMYWFDWWWVSYCELSRCVLVFWWWWCYLSVSWIVLMVYSCLVESIYVLIWVIAAVNFVNIF